MLDCVIEKNFLFLHCISYFTHMANKSLFIILSILLLGCGKHKTTYTSLVQIDNLLKEELIDSALHEVMRINPTTLSENELAYYQLLKVQSQYKSYIPINSDSVINHVIDYYKGTNDIEKLSRSYYLKAGILYDAKKGKIAMEYLKTAEDLLKETDEIALLHNIYFMISTINYDNHECNLSLEYAKKAFQCSMQTRKELHLIYDYERMANAYSCMGQKDSCLYYMKKNLSLIEKVNIPPKHKAGMISNYGMDLIEYDRKQAEEILQKAVLIYPLGSAYSALARIQLDKKDTLKAIDLLQKSIENSQEIRIKQANLFRLSKIEQERGNYKRANELLQQAQQLKDSLTQKLREDNVKALQLEYDKNTEQKHITTLLIYAIVGIFVVLILGGIISLAFARQSTNAKMKAKAEETHAVEAEQYAKQIEQQEKQNSKELKAVNRQLTKIKQKEKETSKEQRQKRKMLERGHVLYSELMEGGNIGQWKRQDFADFIGYYRLTNSDYTATIDQQYTALTPTQNVLTILEHLGKSDQEIMRILCHTEGALRTQRSRLKQRMKNK